MTMTQDPKYNIVGGSLVNSATRKEIPKDEPIFILRGKDQYALNILTLYMSMCSNPSHIHGIAIRLKEFAKFQKDNSERIHEPDTDISSWPGQVEE